MQQRAAEGEGGFDALVARVRAEVEAELGAWLDGRAAVARGRGAEVAVVADALRSLVTRGGKRLRAVLLAAAYDACGGPGGSAAVARAGVSLELLQAYLLVHDDWMDGDDVRRGGPSVPAMLRETFDAEGSVQSTAPTPGPARGSGTKPGRPARRSSSVATEPEAPRHPLDRQPLAAACPPSSRCRVPTQSSS
jgi:hypothetical protein